MYVNAARRLWSSFGSCSGPIALKAATPIPAFAPSRQARGRRSGQSPRREEKSPAYASLRMVLHPQVRRCAVPIICFKLGRAWSSCSGFSGRMTAARKPRCSSPSLWMTLLPFGALKASLNPTPSPLIRMSERAARRARHRTGRPHTHRDSPASPRARDHARFGSRRTGRAGSHRQTDRYCCAEALASRPAMSPPLLRLAAGWRGPKPRS